MRNSIIEPSHRVDAGITPAITYPTRVVRMRPARRFLAVAISVLLITSTGQAMVNLTTVLENYNNSLLTTDCVP